VGQRRLGPENKFLVRNIAQGRVASERKWLRKDLVRRRENSSEKK
jgi:hypothetical protein